MKKNFLILTGAVLALLCGMGIQRASAQVLASDQAGQYTGWLTGTNYGFGFQPWVQYQTGTISNSFTGFFLGGNGDSIDSTNGQLWGIYANGSGTPASEAFRAFSNSMPVNATFKITWHNRGIGFSSANAGGFNLRNGNNTNLQTTSTFLQDGTLFGLYYIGGNGDNFVVYDGHSANPIGVGFGQSPFVVEVTLLPGNMYNLVIENLAGTQVLWSTNAQPLASSGSGTIDSVAMYAFDTSGDQNFNNMEIFDLPPQIVNFQPTNSIYAPAGSLISFAATSGASLINSNQIQVTVNGVLQTGANWTVLNSGTSSNEVTLNTPLVDNQVYNVNIIATDVNGNSATNNFSFNTWDTVYNNVYIEASDYNYGGGQFVNNAIGVDGSDNPIPAGSNFQPNQNYGNFNLLGNSNIDYLVFNTNTNNPYRMTNGIPDYPELETNLDVDHNNFSSSGLQPYDLAFNNFGQWEDYTRDFSNNVTYAVYARMAGFGNNPTMSLERMATPTVSSADQPGAVIGTFVCPQTGGAQNWTFVPLQDFFSRPVLVRFGGTNTYRIQDLGDRGNYNVSYMLFLATNSPGTLRPYVSSGFPFNGVTGYSPLGSVSFTIANSQTSVNPSSIKMLLNSINMTNGLVLSNNAAGTLVTYQPVLTNAMPTGTNTVTVIFSDGSVSQTNSWQFQVEPYATLPTSWALPLTASYSRGFSEQIAKGDDSATNTDFPPRVARAVAQLAGTLTNSQTGLPYANEALNGGINIEPNTINYAIDPEFFGLFAPTNAFPDLPPGTTNNVAMAAGMYVQLSPGLYNFDVYSDDGFQFTAGPTPSSTNVVLGAADFGRAASTTQFSFIVQTNGLYPMQLIYFKAQLGGGGVELYSVNSTNGATALLNDSSNANAVPVYYLTVQVAPTLQISIVGGQAVLTWSDASYQLQSATSVNGPYTTILGAVTGYHVSATAAQQYFRLAKPL